MHSPLNDKLSSGRFQRDDILLALENVGLVDRLLERLLYGTFIGYKIPNLNLVDQKRTQGRLFSK